MRSPFAPLAVAALLLAAPAAASALTVPLDQSTRLTIPGSAASVLVGNPGIADVTVVDSHTLYVLGRAYGVTNVIVLDGHGRTLYNGDVRVAAAGSSVAVYHGTARVDVACSPRCAPSSAPTATDKMIAALTQMAAAQRGQQAGAESPNPASTVNLTSANAGMTPMTVSATGSTAGP